MLMLLIALPSEGVSIDGISGGDASSSDTHMLPSKKGPSSLKQYVEGFDSSCLSRLPAPSSTLLSHARCVFRACLRTPAGTRTPGGHGQHRRKRAGRWRSSQGLGPSASGAPDAVRGSSSRGRRGLREPRRRPSGGVRRFAARQAASAVRGGQARPPCRGVRLPSLRPAFPGSVSWRTVGRGVALVAARKAAAVPYGRDRLAHGTVRRRHPRGGGNHASPLLLFQANPPEAALAPVVSFVGSTATHTRSSRGTPYFTNLKTRVGRNSPFSEDAFRCA